MAKTKRTKNGLTVRKLTIGDAYAYFQIANDASLYRYTNFFMASSLSEARSRIEKFTSHYENLYGLFNKANRLVAVFDVVSNSVEDFDDDVRTANVSYFVGKCFRGRGLASTGIKLLAKELESQYDLFVFEIQSTNKYSIGVQETLGSEKHANSENYVFFTYALSWFSFLPKIEPRNIFRGYVLFLFILLMINWSVCQKGRPHDIQLILVVLLFFQWLLVFQLVLVRLFFFLLVLLDLLQLSFQLLFWQGFLLSPYR